MFVFFVVRYNSLFNYIIKTNIDEKRRFSDKFKY